MRLPAITALAALALAGCAANQTAPMVESGFAPGTLALAAIERQDWATAERLLTDNRMDAKDPARLINLGRVYMATGRTGEALTAWRLALAQERHFEVETVDGRYVSTAVLAQEALTRHASAVRSAAR